MRKGLIGQETHFPSGDIVLVNIGLVSNTFCIHIIEIIEA